mgnify:CR=1 FL=1
MFKFKKPQTQSLSFITEITSKINIKLLITLICLLFIGNSIYANFEELASQVITTKDFIWLLWAIIFSFLSIIINAYAWKLLINSIAFNSNKMNIIKIFLTTNIYKYLPGGVWHFVSRYKILRLKISKQKSLESILLEPLLMLVAALIFIPFGSFDIHIYIICWSSTLVFLPAFRKIIVNKLKAMKTTFISETQKVNSENVVQDSQINFSVIVYPYKPLFVEVIFILFRFFGFYCCINVFSDGSLISLGPLLSSFSLAWIIGLIVPAAPGGLGVFESVVLVGLGSNLPEVSLLASLLCYRFVSTLSDIFAALVYPIKRLIRI